MKVLLKKVGCPLEMVDTNKKYFADCIRSFLGKDITVERVYMGERFGGANQFEFIMGVDEDGLPKQLPFNFFMKFNNPRYPIQTIVGDVVFVRCKPCNPYEEEIWDYEVTDVTDSDKEKIEAILFPLEQRNMAVEFLIRQKGGHL